MSTLKEKALQIQAEKNEKIIPENFSMNLDIFGVQGNILQSTGGDEIYEEPTETQTHIATYHTLEEDEEEGITYKLGHIEHSKRKSLILPNEMHTTCITAETLAHDIGLTSNKIKKDETILGITGTYEGSGDNVIYNINNESITEWDSELESEEIIGESYWLEADGVEVEPRNDIIYNDGDVDIVRTIICKTSGTDVGCFCSGEYYGNCWYLGNFVAFNNTDVSCEIEFTVNGSGGISYGFIMLPHTAINSVPINLTFTEKSESDTIGINLLLLNE